MGKRTNQFQRKDRFTVVHQSHGSSTRGRLACLFVLAWTNAAPAVHAFEGAAPAVGTLAESSGELVAWGRNDFGQLNLRTSDVAAIAAGADYSLALVDSDLHQIEAAGVWSATPAQPLLPAGDFNFYGAVAAGGLHNAALTYFAPASVIAWGTNASGQSADMNGDFIAVAAGGSHTIALRRNGTVVGWGSNSFGQATPPGGTFTAVAAGVQHSVALGADGAVSIWGQNATTLPGPYSGIEAGPFYDIFTRSNGSLEITGAPAVLQSPPLGSFTTVAAGTLHAIAVRDDGTLVGWGDGSFGKTTVPAGVFVAVAAGNDHSLALRAKAHYNGDLTVSYNGPAVGFNGLKANLNRNVTVAGNASISSTLNFFSNSTLDVAGKATFSEQANLNGAGTILAGQGVEFSQASPTLIPAGVKLVSQGPIAGVGGVEVAAGGELATGLSANPAPTGPLLVDAGGKASFIAHGSSAPSTLLVQQGGQIKLSAGQRLNVPGNVAVSGELILDGDRSLFDGAAELQAGGPASSMTLASGALLRADDAALHFPHGATFAAGSQVLMASGINEVQGTIQSNGAFAVNSGITTVQGAFTNTGSVGVLGDAQATFLGDFNQYGEVIVGNVLNPDLPTAASAIFRGAYRGLGATGGGDVTFQGVVSPSSPTTPTATATFSNNLFLGSSSQLFLRLGDGPGGTQFSRLQTSKLLRLSGRLEVTDLGGSPLIAGQSFDLLDWGALVGSFSSVILPGLGPGLAWNTSQLYTSGVLSVVSAPATGDFDHDGDVDGADFLGWQRGGSPTPNSSADLAVWKTNFGVGGATPAAAAVPEPSSKALIVSTLAMLVACRRQWRFRWFD